MINVIMVGAGGIARTHSSSLMHISSANIVGVVDPNKERAATLASTVGTTAYENLDECVDGADSVGKDTGCLRVIPGAHRNPYHDQLWSLHLNVPSAASKDDPHKFENVRPKLLEMWEQATGDKEGAERFLSDPDVNHFGLAPCDIPSFPIESEPGDAVFFSHQLWHSSFGGRVGRRMFTLNFRSAETDE